MVNLDEYTAQFFFKTLDITKKISLTAYEGARIYNFIYIFVLFILLVNHANETFIYTN